MRPIFLANTTICAVLFAPNFRWSRILCVLAVFTLTPIAVATSVMRWPAANRRSTSASRGDNITRVVRAALATSVSAEK